MSYLADYALQVAMQLEQLGHTFYQSLTAGSGNAQIAAIAAGLAADEIRHLQTESMRNSLPVDQRAPKLTDDQLFAVAGKFRKLVLPAADEVRRVAVSGNIGKVMEMAMKMESDSITYYSTLISTLGKSAPILKDIIKEEQKHLDTLRDYRKHLSV